MNELALYLLLSLSNLLGVKSLPPANPNWKVTQSWQVQHDGYVSLKAESQTIADECLLHKEAFIDFPQVIQGVHRIFKNGHLLIETGDPTFNKASPFYYTPILECSKLEAGDLIQWETISYTQYFARILFFPRMSQKTNFLSSHNFINI